MKTRQIIPFVFLLSALSAPCLAQDWTGTWATSIEPAGKTDMPKSGNMAQSAVRQIIHVSVGGDCLRLQLSNEYSSAPVEIRSVFIADATDSCDIDRKSAKYLTFDKKRNVTIEPGKYINSDEIKYNLKPLQRLAVTISYGAAPNEPLTGHRGSRTTSYIVTGTATPKTAFGKSERTDHWYNIAALDVKAEGMASIAVLGNSITDGRGSTTNLQNRWTDTFAEALQNNENIKNIAVLNQGIGGNCVVRGGLGPTALKRFDRDVMSMSGLKYIIIFEGINDIGGSMNDSEAKAKDLIKAYEEFIGKAHAKGIKIIGATITPFGKSFYDHGFFREAARQTVNQWIRTSGKFDAVIDFDQFMRDPAHPSSLIEKYQEDWLHPNAAGYKVMGDYAAKQFAEFLKNQK